VLVTEQVLDTGEVAGLLEQVGGPRMA
jgi:hypothetical protein